MTNPMKDDGERELRKYNQPEHRFDRRTPAKRILDDLWWKAKGDQIKQSIPQTDEAEKVILALIRSENAKAVLEILESVRHKVGWEEEPDFDPGDATYGDTEHDHNAVVYGRNEVKGAVQGILENEIAPLKRQQGPTNAK